MAATSRSTPGISTSRVEVHPPIGFESSGQAEREPPRRHGGGDDGRGGRHEHGREVRQQRRHRNGGSAHAHRLEDPSVPSDERCRSADDLAGEHQAGQRDGPRQEEQGRSLHVGGGGHAPGQDVEVEDGHAGGDVGGGMRLQASRARAGIDELHERVLEVVHVGMTVDDPGRGDDEAVLHEELLERCPHDADDAHRERRPLERWRGAFLFIDGVGREGDRVSDVDPLGRARPPRRPAARRRPAGRRCAPPR